VIRLDSDPSNEELLRETVFFSSQAAPKFLQMCVSQGSRALKKEIKLVSNLLSQKTEGKRRSIGNRVAMRLGKKSTALQI